MTWLGGASDEGAKSIDTHHYTLADGQFTQTATDESCEPRKVAYDGTFAR